MAMPTGDDPTTALQYYAYLDREQVRGTRVDTWHTWWPALGWMYGILLLLAVVTVLWVYQYRSTRQRMGVYQTEDWDGYVRESAGPLTWFGRIMLGATAAFVAVLILTHIFAGQDF